MSDLLSPSSAVPVAVVANPRIGRRRTRKRFWLLLVAAGCLSMVYYPPAWHLALRSFLSWQAATRGCNLTVGSMEGGLFDSTQLYDVQLSERVKTTAGDSTPGARYDGELPQPGTDVTVSRVQITLNWARPWSRARVRSWISELTIEGVNGRCDFGAARGSGRVDGSPARRIGTVFQRFANLLGARCVPASFTVRAGDLTLQRGRYRFRARDLQLIATQNGPGVFLARQMEIGGPGFASTLVRQHGGTAWKGTRFTVSGLDFGDDVRLVDATLDGSHLSHQRLGWDCSLTALGGDVRAEGEIDFSRERLGLEIAARLRKTSVGSLARRLGIAGSLDGRFQEANFTFRGDPENWQAAEMWLSGQATDFHWGDRRWQSLDMQAVVVNRRVQVHRLDLRQSRNRLSVSGEFPLPPVSGEESPAGGNLRWWQATGFSCDIDARVDDLHELAGLLGPDVPPFAGRMSVNGRLSAVPNRADVEGYLNVEGSSLNLRGAPLDYLKATLLFHGGELEIADIQATRGSDYFNGKGQVNLGGPLRPGGTLRVAVDDISVYAAACAGLPWMGDMVNAAKKVVGSFTLRDGILHLDDCQVQRADSTCRVGGTIDFVTADAPVLALTVDGGTTVPFRGQGPGSRPRAEFSLELSGSVGDVTAVSGSVRLLGVELGESLRFSMDGPQEIRLPVPIAEWLPDAWRDCQLALEVTVAGAPATGANATDARAIADLQVTGTGAYPLVGGRLELPDRTTTQLPWGGAYTGAAFLYFDAEHPGNPRVSFEAVGKDGARTVCFFGPSDGGNYVLWDTGDVKGKGLLDMAVESPVMMAERVDGLPLAREVPAPAELYLRLR